MSLTSAMMVGFTGIKSNGATVDTVGDNLANLNTTAFKGQRTLFETLMYQTIHEGTAPGPTSGGTLPRQIGFGSGVSAIQRNFRQGGIESTGFQPDLAVQGDGFFILDAPEGRQVFTRDGAFHLDATNTLVSTSGSPLQIFAADSAGTIDTAALNNLVIPLGSAREAVATTEVALDGRLDGATNLASAGAVVVSDPLVTAGGTPATASTPLTDLVDRNGIPLFATGDVVQINAAKGGIAVSQSIFTVGTDGSSVGDFATFLQDALGISVDASAGGTPGVTIAAGPDPVSGSLVIHSNVGEVNAIELDSASIVNTTGVVPAPFSFATTTPATGAGVTTSFGVFDSLGNLVDVRVRLVLESKSAGGTTWRFFAESAGDLDVSPDLGTGTLTFDPNGQFVGATGTDLAINRGAAGAATPLSFTVDFSRMTGLASPDGRSEIFMTDQNGAPEGIMTGYAISSDGIVTGSFSNQQTQILGQVALATFVNREGLIALGENNFVPGVNSGDPNILAPQTQTAGSIVSGALEQSNVEIAREFINLITAQTGIASAGRVVRVADELLQELLLIVR